MFQANAKFSDSKNYIDLPKPTYRKLFNPGPDLPPTVVQINQTISSAASLSDDDIAKSTKIQSIFDLFTKA
jgi:hypothetical protein